MTFIASVNVTVELPLRLGSDRMVGLAMIGGWRQGGTVLQYGRTAIEVK